MELLNRLIDLHARCIDMAEVARANPYNTASAWKWLERAERLDEVTNRMLDDMEARS